MESHFACAERARQQELILDIRKITNNSLINTIFKISGGMIAVLNRQRQIIAINETLLGSMGISDPQKALGLRPGEFLKCIHAHEMEAGCGTSRFCESCGAAAAIVSSLEFNKPVERYCALSATIDNETRDLLFSVRAAPVNIERNSYILLFLYDITEQHNASAINRVFFHDLRNLLSSLAWTSECIQSPDRQDKETLSRQMHALIFQLQQEVKVQQYLLEEDRREYQTEKTRITVSDIVANICRFYQHHPSSREKTLEVPKTIPDITLEIDSTLLLRVLINMIINAFEASIPGDFVKLSIIVHSDSVVFCIWNRKSIPEKYRLRIFQRNFSTKNVIGRGLGTYSMKLFGEKYLKGSVSFTSGETEGTQFCLTVPVQ